MISVPALEPLVALITFPVELHESDQIAGGGQAVRAEAGIETFTG
jgi:hypothetical protein